MAETSTKLFEHAYYIGNYMSGILYGLEVALYLLILRKLRKCKAGSTRTRRFFGAFSTIGLVLLTVDISCNAAWGEIMWIEGRELPGGVPAFVATQVSVWYQTMGSATVVALIFMGDALLLYRLFVIWGSSLSIMIIPILAYLAAFALAIIQLVVSGKPGGNFFEGKSIDFGTPYYTITIVLNVVVTILICTRLIRLYSSLSQIAENSHLLKFFTRLTSVLIESAALYSLVGITFLILYASGSEISIAFGQVWAKLTCICPHLIILKMANGCAWDRKKVMDAESTLHGRFRPTSANVEHELGQGDRSRKSSLNHL